MKLGLGLSLSSMQRRRDTLASVIAALFGNDEPGFFYDFDDWSTLFQDVAGTQPVTAPNQGVALALDKSGNGTHATQDTTAARPFTAVHPDGGVRNEADGSDTLATQTVTVTAQERTLSFRGTGTVTLTGASTAGPLVGTGADNIVSLTFTPSAGNLTLTVSGAVSDVMLELGAVRTNYQRRVNHLDVTEAGKKSIRRLYFNGTSHFMETPTIAPNTDKVQVFAGVRKLSNGPAGVILETSSNSANNNGSIGFFSPGRNNTEIYRFGSRGTSRAILETVAAAPLSNVITALGDISAPFVKLRLEGIQVAQNTDDQGAGNFLAYPASIGARSTGDLFFNGFFDQFITRFGVTPDETTIGTVEKYISTKSPEVPTL